MKIKISREHLKSLDGCPEIISNKPYLMNEKQIDSLAKAIAELIEQ